MSCAKSTALALPSRCARDHTGQWPIYAEGAELFLPKNEISPQWLLRPIDDEDDNKAIAAEMKRHRRRYPVIHLWRRLKYMFSSPGMPPEVRPFRWLISYHVLPKGYQHGQKDQPPPWRMLVRCFLIDVPSQLSDSKQIKSIRSWQKYPAKGREAFYHRTELDDAPPNITCGKRVVFSPQKKNLNKSLCGDWLFVVYLWAADRPWAEHMDVRKLLLFCNIFSVQAWEWADGKTPYLFYELRQGEDGRLLDTANDKLQCDDDNLAYLCGRTPGRLSALRRIMNAQARFLLAL
ncbi:uncharacterized protein TrAFT101_009612 [Trichoderma asperellum]|uniref:uncharacterized protein n=1 Tax=Trichoderma asperellum TaxID=101201 RepID=UPI00331D14F0|nr:hypothetical protein TrAFT101_009612 [Trichoderma asperellum]